MTGKGDLIIDETIEEYVGHTIQPKETFFEWDITFSQIREYKIAALCRLKSSNGMSVTLVDEGEKQGSPNYMIQLSFENPRTLVNFLTKFKYLAIDDSFIVKDVSKDEARYMPKGLHGLGLFLSLIAIFAIGLSTLMAILQYANML